MVGSFSVRFGAMASECEVRLAASSQAHADALAQCAIDEVARIEAAFSRYRPGTIVSRINDAAGRDWVDLDSETEALLGYADTLFEGSEGKFDITSGVLRRAWDFRQGRVPAQAALAPLLELVGWQRVQRAPGRIRLPQAGMELDFGGFGKEYAADRAAAILKETGARHGYVNLGGDLHVFGPQPDGSAWMIGIQDPRDAGRTIASIPVQAGALATSGDYERFFEQDGKRYCHVLDPASGFPVGYWRSVSVLAPLAIAAGSYATITLLLEERGLDFLRDSGLDFLAVDHQGRVFNEKRSHMGSASGLP
ncbi:MAG: FAD:protein FMN transferase [Pseudomonadota bacterium]